VNLISLDDFLTWAHSRGLEPGWGSSVLAYPEGRGDSRFWYWPELYFDMPRWIAYLVEGLGPSECYYLWPKGGVWLGGESSWDYRVQYVTLQGLGVPIGHRGPIRFPPSKTDCLVAAVYARVLLINEYMGDGTDDVCVYPDHGQAYLEFNHHIMTYVYCADASRMAAFVQHMSRAGCALPTEIPYEGYERPAWMGPEEDDNNSNPSPGRRTDEDG
jgi:hypothetical protein